MLVLGGVLIRALMNVQQPDRLLRQREGAERYAIGLLTEELNQEHRFALRTVVRPKQMIRAWFVVGQFRANRSSSRKRVHLDLRLYAPQQPVQQHAVFGSQPIFAPQLTPDVERDLDAESRPQVLRT
jgi:hypothetical protein